MDAMTEHDSRNRGRWPRTMRSAGLGALAAAGLIGAVFVGVANADEAPAGTDSTTQDENAPSTDSRGSDENREAPDGGRDGSLGPPNHGDAGHRGMPDSQARGGDGSDDSRRGGPADCDEQESGDRGSDEQSTDEQGTDEQSDA